MPLEDIDEILKLMIDKILNKILLKKKKNKYKLSVPKKI